MPRMTQPEPLPGIFRIGQLELALPVRVEQQEVDRRVDAGVGEAAQPLDRRRRIGLAGKIGQRDQEMRFELQPAQRHHQAASLTSSARGLAAISSSSASSRCSTVWSNRRIEHFGPPAGAIAQEIRKVEDGAEKILPFPLPDRYSRQPRQPVFLGG